MTGGLIQKFRESAEHFRSRMQDSPTNRVMTYSISNTDLLQIRRDYEELKNFPFAASVLIQYMKQTPMEIGSSKLYTLMLDYRSFLRFLRRIGELVDDSMEKFVVPFDEESRKVQKCYENLNAQMKIIFKEDLDDENALDLYSPLYIPFTRGECKDFANVFETAAHILELRQKEIPS
jgi:hypothetical protein